MKHIPDTTAKASASAVTLPATVPPSDTLWRMLTNGYSHSSVLQMSARDLKTFTLRAESAWATICSEAGNIANAAVEPTALGMSIKELDDLLDTECAEPLTPSQVESIMLVRAELKRLRAAPVHSAALDAVEIAALEASIGHLSHLVDNQTTIAMRAVAAMQSVQYLASPFDESNGDLDARIPYAIFAAFVDEQVALTAALRASPAATPLAGAVVAYRVLRMTAHGVWNDGGTGWQDGPPSSDLVDSLSEYPAQWRIEYAHAAPQGRKCANHAKSKREGQEATVAAMPLCWVPEDELPESLPPEAYGALFPHSRVDIVRLFPIFGAPPTTPAAPADALTHTELLEIRRAADDFKNHGETDVADELLVRGALAGYLECTHFQLLNESALDMDIQAAAQKDGGT